MAIPDFSSVADSAAFNSAVAWGNAGANLALQAAQTHNNHNNAMATMRLSLAGVWAMKLAGLHPSAARSAQTILTGRDSHGVMESIAMAQIAAKVGRTVPPIT